MDNEIKSALIPGDSELSGRYIYGIVLGAIDFQTTGIDGNPVYIVSHRDISALVHACSPRPYQSNDRDQVGNWLRQHQNVVEEALKSAGSVIPMSFDIIIDGPASVNPDDVLKQWLQERYDSIKILLERLCGTAEYGIKIYYSIETITAKAVAENPEIAELSNRLASMSKGTAFLFKSELSQKIRKAIEVECKNIKNEILNQIRQMIIDYKENKTDPEVSNNQKMILNLAVLADPDKVEVIGDFLESLQTIRRYTVFFTGPWPAYSFVADLEDFRR